MTPASDPNLHETTTGAGQWRGWEGRPWEEYGAVGEKGYLIVVLRRTRGLGLVVGSEAALLSLPVVGLQGAAGSSRVRLLGASCKSQHVLPGASQGRVEPGRGALCPPA
ncbi:hypothetical protein E2C01_096604 [Portunus trituberculatus]|uniref:Uncharacterized protein n=1 Tax=Portunus trituberculatus TaxID=210409 RepID=A0A5B7JW23_PORTR|nr:hypothetical protein [Portunus trituberculatus]